MKVAYILFASSVVVIASGISFQAEGSLEFGRVLLLFAVIAGIVEMLGNIATDPTIKQMFNRK